MILKTTTIYLNLSNIQGIMEKLYKNLLYEITAIKTTSKNARNKLKKFFWDKGKEIEDNN